MRGHLLAISEGRPQEVRTTSPLGDVRVALCHEWFTTLGGSDRVAAHIADLIDVDAIFTFTFQQDLIANLLPRREVRLAHPIGRYARNRWPLFLPLMPYAWRSLNLEDFDVVITSSHAFVNCITPAAKTTVVSYCYTPMRYAWEPQVEAERVPALLRPAWPAIAAAFRAIDRRGARRVDRFIADSHFVAARILKHYGREATVIYPPVDLDYWTPDDEPREDFFLLAGRLVAYKRPDIAVDAFSRSGIPLVVAGSGPMLKRLRKKAGSNVRFEVQPSRERLRDLYRRARALVHPGIEDFGIIVVEAQGCGTPVVALNRGGVKETVVDGETGHLYDDPSPVGLMLAVEEFDRMSLDEEAIVGNAQRFDHSNFDVSFLSALSDLLRQSKQVK